MDLLYHYGQGNNVTVFYEGASANGLLHTIRLEDGTKLDVHDSNLQLLNQPYFSKIPKNPLDYRNEVGTGLSLEEAQDLSRPIPLSPLKKELISWHRRLYHFPFRVLSRLSSIGFLPKKLLGFRNKPPLCIACQFGQAHHCPWRTKGKNIGSIRKTYHKEPGDGISVDQIISAQTGLILQMSGFLTNQQLWGCTTFVYHVSDYVYMHLMQYLSLAETLICQSGMGKIHGPIWPHGQTLSR